MESISTTFSIIIAFWVSGIFMAWLLLWLPAIKIIRVLEPDNVAYKFRFIGGIVFTCLAGMFLPFIIHIILSDFYRERFLRAFIPAYLGKKDE